MSLIIQLFGGIFYLLNKIFLSITERRESIDSKDRTWRIRAWIVYLIGLPAWVLLFIREHNWIAAALEIGGAPSMILGLTIAIKGKEDKPKWLDAAALVAIVLGLSYSWYDFHGIRKFSQWLEIGIVTGFLIGTYQLALERLSGYVWYLFMCGCCATLMYFEKYPWLLGQQLVSILFILDAYIMKKRRRI